MAVLGINDSHDCGSSAVSSGSVISAVNEERFTKNKNEVGFPYNSIKYVAKNTEEEITDIALAWIGGNALISRVIPSWDRKRRAIWRREIPRPSRATLHLMNVPYKLIQNQRPRMLWKAFGTPISKSVTAKRLALIDGDLAHKRMHVVEHHLSHAASAYFTSGFSEALIITLDGSGDGLSGTVSTGDNGEIKRLAEFRASTSLGIMYGAATVACDMRYSEDEGKLMSLAAYSYPAEIPELWQFSVYDPKSKNFVSKIKTRNEILLAEYLKDHVLSKYDRESFAYAVQKHAELQVTTLVRQWIKETGIHNVAVAGGFFSNVLVNRAIEHMPEVEKLFVFPQMGDGGLSLGAAAYIDFSLHGKFNRKQIDNVYFGPGYTNEQIFNALKKSKNKKISYEPIKDPAGHAAELVAKKNEILLWFQGRMEYGPRALGNRSVIALPNDPENRYKLNLIIKKRPFYQPFASSMLEGEANRLLEDCVGPNRFMTSANAVRVEHRKDLVAASHIDYTTRPQMVSAKENKLYFKLISGIAKETGFGAILNTSLNKHRRTIALDPEDAIWTLENTGATKLVIGDYLVSKKA